MMTRLFKSIISALLMFSFVAVLPAEAAVESKQIEFAVEQECEGTLVASADVKKKKKKGKKFSKKGKKKKKGFFSKVFGSKN